MKPRNILVTTVLAAASVLSAIAYAAAPDALGGSAFPFTLISTSPINLVDGFNEMLQIINAQTVGISTTYPGAASIPSTGVDTSAVTFSTSIQGNPLVQYNATIIPITSSTSGVNTAGGFTVLASESGRSLRLAGPVTFMASGTAATAVAELVVCSNGNILESAPISTLVNNVPVYSSGVAGIFLGSSFAGGCPASNSILVSNSGSAVTTMTGLFVNIPYTVQ